MDTGSVLIANLSKGPQGEDATATLGELLVSTIGLAALNRTEGPAEAGRPFVLYLDEFHIFTTLAFCVDAAWTPQKRTRNHARQLALRPSRAQRCRSSL